MQLNCLKILEEYIFSYFYYILVIIVVSNLIQGDRLME